MKSQKDLCLKMLRTTQYLQSVKQPVAALRDVRHLPANQSNTMVYEVEHEREGVQLDGTSEIYTILDGNGSVKEERNGVTHLVHAWGAQGQPYLVSN